MNVGFISLGCSKNLVDTEMMIGLFKNEKYNIVNNPKEADIIVINTCGFIESAKEEAINTMLEMAKYKIDKNGKSESGGHCKYLIATGCLVERYKEELEKSIPEVDLFVKFSEYNTIWKQIEDAINKYNKNEKINDAEDYKKLDFMERIITTGKNYAYLRVAEGCNNFCTFCAIPYIRGRFVSRKEEDVIEEAKKLAKQGIKELIVIAQDTTKYGEDIYGKPKLADLLNKLSKIDGIEWIRFLYSYPETITEDLIEEVKNNKKVCKYFDIPMQHISDKVLKKMNRKTTKESTMKLIEKLRKEIPDVIIRSTLMVGFPGETADDFNQMYDFVKWAKFDKLGCFTYSKEDGTPASNMENQVHPMTKKSRYNKIMKLQQQISYDNLKNNIGKEMKVLIEGKSDIKIPGTNEFYLIGRTYMDVPEIDGVIYVAGKANINEFCNCIVTDVTDEYDLIGKIKN
jgi:ribosomal protein S12 methylthiotransferase